jgi:hypothetical protein
MYCIVHCLPSVSVGRDVDFPAFLVRENTCLWLDSLGLHVGGRCDNRQQVRHLLGHPLRRLLLPPLLLGSARLQLVGCFGLQPGLLLGVERVAFRLPLHLDAGLVVLHVAGRVAVQVANVETRAGFLAELLAFDADAVFLAVHHRMLAVHHTANRAQGLGELVSRRHGRPLLARDVFRQPALQPALVGLRAGKPGFRGLVPQRAGGLGGGAFAVGNGEILAFLSTLFLGLGLTFRGRAVGLPCPLGEGSGVLDACRKKPGLFLTIPTRTQRLRLVFLVVRHIETFCPPSPGRSQDGGCPGTPGGSACRSAPR